MPTATTYEQSAIDLEWSLGNFTWDSLESMTWDGASTVLHLLRINTAINVLTTANKAAKKTLQEEITAGESISRAVSYKRTFVEALSASDSLVKAGKKQINTAIRAGEQFIKPYVEGVQSEIGLFNEAMDVEKFKALLAKERPLGFDEWQEFFPGDFSFKEILFRLTIQNNAPDTITDIKVKEHKVRIDVEDMVEKGIQDVYGTSRVYFQKNFHAPPSVMLTGYVAPEFAIPEIVETTKEWFEIRVRKQDGNDTRATINWLAHGY